MGNFPGLEGISGLLSAVGLIPGFNHEAHLSKYLVQLLYVADKLSKKLLYANV